MSESDPVSVRCESVILVSDFHNFSCSLIVNKESSSCDTCSACCKNLFRRLNLQKTSDSLTRMRFVKIRQANLQWRLVERHSQQQVSHTTCF
ncbi:hypothetical protein Hdeb2414_s0002g00079041 [Helianthus debilis subsp. tardiflorus]